MSRDGPYGRDAESARPAWGRGALLIATGGTFHASWLVALVVGCLLTSIHQGGQILAGDVGPGTLVRVLANFLIPYVVSSIGYLHAHPE